MAKKPDWPAIEPHYRAGLRTMSEIAREFGVSRAAIFKHAAKQNPPWLRDLEPAIKQAAQALVTKEAAKVTAEQVTGYSDKVTKTAPAFTDTQIVEAGASQLALVRIGHRQDIAALRAIIRGLLADLGATVAMPESFAIVYDVLANLDEPAVNTLREMAEIVTSLPGRTKIAKDLADAMHKCIGMEREAFGLDTKGGTDGLPLVIIKDYTGRGSPEAPPREEFDA